MESIRLPQRLQLVRELVGTPRAVRRHRLDVVLTLSERLPPLGATRYVTWLFEIPNHRIGQNRAHGAGAYQRAPDAVTELVWRRSLRRAGRVVASSAATAAEIEREVPSLTGAVPVIAPGLPAGFSPGAGWRSEPSLFHLGSSDPRDNSETVLAAYALARPSIGIPLVVAGGLGGRGQLLEDEARRLGVGDTVEFVGRVTDDDLLALYRGASVYLDASLFEGFGYQVLEAMACGAPVVASTATSIPEVVGDAGLLCDPRSPDEISAALVRVVGEPGLASDLRARSIERARLFDWDETARRFVEILERAAAA